jgi:general secretion pathway protein A
MYKHFFGLRENPFSVNPDPRYLFLTPLTRQALDDLEYGIQTRKGLLLLTGEVGTGKTTLINRLLDHLGQQQPTAFIFNSHLETNHLFDFMLADFGVPFDSELPNNVLMRLNRWLIERYRAGDTPVLIVDEAQGLPTHMLEEIRMLLNLETPREKLLQIVLVGQPELEERIKRPELRQIKQRVALRCKTAALALQETHDYIQSRLDIAGANGKPIFAPQAIDAVHLYSRGIPRVMNLLCENALIDAYLERVQSVPVRIVEEIACKFQFDDVKPVAPRREAENAADFNCAAPESRSVNLETSSPATPEPPLKELAEAMENLVSPPQVVADNVFALAEELAPSIVEYDEILEAKGGAESSRPSNVSIATPSASLPTAGMETSRPSQLSATFSDVSNRFSSRSAMKAVPLALSSLPHGRLRSWKRRRLSGAVSPARVPGTAIVLRRLKRSLESARAWYQRCLVLRQRHLHFAGSLDWPPVTASVYRWLRQPWNPKPWRLPESRLLELLRRSAGKKA